ncbi:MAG: S41 family peptidase, partial [Thiothrix sp.]
RDIIQVKSVKQRLLEPGYGYLRISSFQAKTGDALLEGIEALKKENKDKLRGLILDLRNNPGGVLNAAVSVSDAFLDSGKIVYTDGRVADAKSEYNASRGDVLEGIPIVVMVNRGSASASEIVAGALQDHKRALVVGQRTFGKGSVQTVLQLDEKTGVKLTTARYFTPTGRSIQAEGIVPDIELKPLKVNGEGESDAFEPLTEADLNKHLSNPNAKEKAKAADTANSADGAEAQPAAPTEVDVEKKAVEPASENTSDTKPGAAEAKTADTKTQVSAKKPKSLAEEDYQLFESLNILKGMDLVQSRLQAPVTKTAVNTDDKVM